MLRILFGIFILMHGFVHLTGFVKEWNIGRVTRLSGKTLLPLSPVMSRVAGALWLVAALGFALSACGWLFRKEWWWVVAFCCVILSQPLIIIYWKDARTGTIVNAILLVVAVAGFSRWSFDKKVNGEIRAFIAHGRTEQNIMVPGDVSGSVPPVIARWLERAGVNGKELPGQVALSQKGEMKIRPEGPWMEVNTHQYFTIQEPGFIWKADVRGSPLIRLSGRDRYAEGKGNMLIKLYSLIPVADASGPETDQGALVRYLSEIIWFPHAALQDYITWGQTGPLSARATMSHGGITASGLFRFSEQGDPVSFEAERYYEQQGEYSLETWFISMDEHREMDGVRIPVRGEVTWKLESGDFTWYTLEITGIRYFSGTLPPGPLKIK